MGYLKEIFLSQQILPLPQPTQLQFRKQQQQQHQLQLEITKINMISSTTTITTTAPPTTTTQYPPDCEYTGQTLPYPDSCRKYYECLADSTWMVFDCCPY